MSTKLGQLTTIIGQMEKSINSLQELGRFPSDNVVNPRKNYSANALRSGNSYEKFELEESTNALASDKWQYSHGCGLVTI